MTLALGSSAVAQNARVELLTPDAIAQELRARGLARETDAKRELNLKALARSSKALQDKPDAWLLSLYHARVKSIYGPDDRLDIYDLALESPDRASAEAVVALFRSTSIQPNSDGQPNGPASGISRLITANFGLRYRLCETTEERFRDQPTGAYCSGALIGPEHVLTAGHCIGNARYPVTQTRFVFGFRMNDANTPVTTISSRDIYAGTAVVGRSETVTSDWAIVKLDRPVMGRAPLPVARFKTDDANVANRRVADGEAIFTLGHPCGLPLKHTGNANVKENDHPSYFVANLDTYGGNSGSPVIASRNSRHEIVGILVRGLEDFDFLPAGNCYTSMRYRDSEAGEVVVRTTEFTQHLP